jgi:hypothetical protein
MICCFSKAQLHIILQNQKLLAAALLARYLNQMRWSEAATSSNAVVINGRRHITISTNYAFYNNTVQYIQIGKNCWRCYGLMKSFQICIVLQLWW